MRPDAFAPPLTVWAGQLKYVFAPGRDVIVGYGPGCDVPLDRLGNGAPMPAERPDVVLRFTGRHWVAIDRSASGIFVNGARASTVEIRDGQAITLGDPRRGPRLVFQTASPAGPPGRFPGPPRGPDHPAPLYAQSRLARLPAARVAPFPPPPPAPPGRPNGPRDARLRAPTERTTQQMPAPTRPPASPRPVQPTAPGATSLPPVAPFVPTPPPPPSQPQPIKPAPEPIEPRVADDVQPKGRGLIRRMGDATRKMRAQRPSFRSQAADTTFRLPLRPGARTLGVAAYQLGLAVDAREVVASISFTARVGTLTAITGPSAARNSALLELLAGTRQPSSGAITVDGHDMHAEPESMRARIGIVSRDETLHRRLTVEQAVGYAAELRLPPDTSPELRRRVVNQVLEELGLTAHRETAIRKLSPELRRCAALAVELVTRPTVLLVDEPGAGLDSAQQDHVMAVLRRQADIGCVVVVAVSPRASLTHLNLCDQVLVLTSAGRMAFLGTPLQVESSMGSADWAEVIAEVSADPEGAQQAFRVRQQALTAPPEVARPWPVPAELTTARQIWLVARRELRLLLADPVYSLFLALLPFALAGLTLLIPGDSGLNRPDARSANMHQAVEILAALNIAAVIIGTAVTIRALVSERRVFRREQAVGLSATAYLLAKLIVSAVAAAILTAIVVTIVVAVRGGPAYGAVLLGNATIELYLSVAVTAIVSAAGGLLLSTLGKSLREVLPLLVPVILASALFAGGLLPLVGTWGYDQISWLVPAQWGFAASASVVDLRRVDTLAADIEMWAHYSGWWVFDMAMLTLFGVAWAGLTRYRLRRPDTSAVVTSRTAGPE